MPVSVPPEPTPTTIASTSPLHLAQDFRAGRRLVRARIGGIGELVDEEGAGRAPRDRLGEVLVVVGMALAHVRARDDDLGAHGLGVQHLLARHLVGHDEQRAIALAAADQGETEPGIAGGGFDDGAAGLEAPVGLRRLDHGARRAVLDRAGRIRALELEKQPARTTVDARDLDERRVADEIEHRGHDGSIALRGRSRDSAPIVSPSSIRPAPCSPLPAVPWSTDARNRERRPGAIR